jgi:hypothetical protein
MKRSMLWLAVLASLGAALWPSTTGAEQRGRLRAEVVAWSADASVVVFAEPRAGSRREWELVARRVPSGEVAARIAVFPGPCARRIEGDVAIAHACALAQLRPRLPGRMRDRSFHVAASSRSRISTITLRADGSIVEHELPRLGLVLRGRVETERQDRSFAVLEIGRIGREEEPRVLDRRPVRPRARRRWTLLEAGDDRYVLVGRGFLQRIGRSARGRAGNPPPASPSPPQD